MILTAELREGVKVAWLLGYGSVLNAEDPGKTHRLDVGDEA